MDEGWIKIYRKIQDNELWTSEPFTRAQAWIDLLLIANHKRKTFFIRGNEIIVYPGQFAYAETTLAKKWKWSRNKVRRFLNWLETIQQIKQQKNRVLSIYSVLNYKVYQSNDTINDTTDDTTERQQKVQQKDINKNVKNEKNNNILLSDKQKELSKTPKTWTRPEPSKWSNLQKIVFHLEDVLQTKITNWGKQGAAYKLMVSAGYTDEQIVKAISYLAQDEFFRDKGFDLMTVSNQIPLLKAKARRIYEQHQVN